MPKPNYSHQKKQREEAARKKREEKQLRRQQKKEESPAPVTPEPISFATPNASSDQ